MRLDRYLSHVTLLTRSQARQLISRGRVSVNGSVVKRPATVVPIEAEVCLDGQPVARPGLRYFMLNKPKGYVCSTDDSQNSSVLELLEEPVLTGLHFVGRLDIDTTGLVLITDDGEWSHRITSPKQKYPKTYLVTLAEPLSAKSADRLRAGILLHNEITPTSPAELEKLSDTHIRLTITEGRYHQVKRMLAAVSNRVIELHRERIATFTLDAELKLGQYRPLSTQEILSASQSLG